MFPIYQINQIGSRRTKPHEKNEDPSPSEERDAARSPPVTPAGWTDRSGRLRAVCVGSYLQPCVVFGSFGLLGP